MYATKCERFKTGLAPLPNGSNFPPIADACRPVGGHPIERGFAMKKIVIGSGLGLAAAAMPAHAAGLPLATAPAGVSEAGRINFAQADETQGVLIGLSKPGVAPQDKQNTYDKFKTQDKFNTGVKMNPYDKMNAQAQLKIKGESQIKLNGDGLKTGDIKSAGDSQIKVKSGSELKIGDIKGASNSQIKVKSGSEIKYGSGGGEGIKLQPGQQLKTGNAGLLCDGIIGPEKAQPGH